MAMFQYFPGNYVWNLAIDIAIESGAKIGEIEEMCRPLLDHNGGDDRTGDFLGSWMAMADKLVSLADEDEEAAHGFSAGAKLQRAALYYITAERMQGHGATGRDECFSKGQLAFRRAMALGHENVERFEIPYEGAIIPALFIRADDVIGSAPTLLYVNGLDSCKELLFWSSLPRALARRGISTLCVDQPGTGEALRSGRLHATHEAERWASPLFDWLAARDDVDAKRIGMAGISLGGYYTPRAMAMDSRFASGAVWGANHDWAEVQRKRLKREGENPVPHYWAHVMWAFGATDMEDFITRSAGMTLDGILDRIQVPFLVLHGEKDRQISADYAQRSFGVEHVGVDNMSFGCDYIADWFAETLGGRTA
jgi:pimeloyl-ACP methyl ester carboxylesterase